MSPHPRRGFGVRMISQYRSASYLNVGDNLLDSLRLSPLATFISGHYRRAATCPDAWWLIGARLSVSLNNLTGSRQHVRDRLGETPLLYQPAYLDPIRRTLQLELRKVLEDCLPFPYRSLSQIDDPYSVIHAVYSASRNLTFVQLLHLGSSWRFYCSQS